MSNCKAGRTGLPLVLVQALVGGVMDTDGFPDEAAMPWRPLGREHIRKVAKGQYRIPGIQHDAGLVG
jgi:hypothetical protein